MYKRWYSQRVRAESLFEILRPGFEEVNVDFKNVRAWVGSVMGIILAAFVLLVLVISLGQNENNKNNKATGERNPNGLLLLVGMGAGLTMLGGGVTWAIVATGNRDLKNRLFAFDDVTKTYDIKSCGNYPITEDYGLPLFHSVDLAECPGKTLSAWLCGKWKETEFAWLQGGQLVDPYLRTVGDNQLLNVGLKVAFGRKANRINRLKRAGFDAVVFSEELNLPDIILGNNGVIETSYTRRAVKDVAQPLPGVPVTSLALWGAVSDPSGGEGVYGALADLVHSRKCLIQVIGGRVVVFLNSFIGLQSGLVSSQKDVERELDFAHSIFQRLKLVAQSKDPATAASVDAHVVAAAFKPTIQYRPSMGKLITGACLLLFGGMSVFGAMVAQKKINQEQPEVAKIVEIEDQADAIVSNGGLKRRKDSAGTITAVPWLEYSYQVYGQSYKRKSALTKGRKFLPVEEAKTMLRKYKRGSKLKAWFDPASPSKSSLVEKIAIRPKPAKAKLPNKVDLRGAIAFAGLLSVVGLGLIIVGLIGNRAKAVVPDFTGEAQAGSNIRSTTSRTSAANTVGSVSEAEPEWSGLSSAKYFTQQPSGMLD